MWILVIGPEGTEDQPEGAVACLRELGCKVEIANLWDPLDQELSADNPPTVVIIDAGDHVDAGRATLVRIRAVGALEKVPVIVGVSVNGLTRLDVADGFDDFVLVPYVPAELYSRIRRVDWLRSEFTQQERIKVAGMCIDLAAHEVLIDGVAKQLTHQEFALLSFLCQNRGRVFSRQQLLERVWGVDYYGSSRTVDIHVRRLRMKLGRAVEGLETVRGAGYKMKAP